MNYALLRFFALSFALLLSGLATGQDRCATPQRDSLLARQAPGWARSRQQLEVLIQSRLREQEAAPGLLRVTADVVQIPTVVHIVHNNQAGTIGGTDNGNISEAQVLSQIRVLNEDYRRRAGTNGFNTNPVGADMEIEFVLARRDPSGNTSSGITRHYTTRTGFDVFGDANTLANIVSWPTDRYLNIWVVTFSGSGYLGVAQYPSVAGITGLDTSEENFAKTDGVIISHQAFGTLGTATADAAYRYGRTTTHEIGHWLGLIHTWGDALCGDDYCPDTPRAENSNRSRNCNAVFSNCGGTRTQNMIENYLDYSADICMNTFTQNQKQRVRAVLASSPRRLQLVNSLVPLPETETLTLTLFSNPVRNSTVEFDAQYLGQREVTVSLFDLQGHTLRAETFPDQSGNRFSIDRQGVSGGLYLLRVQAGAETTVRRVLLLD